MRITLNPGEKLHVDFSETDGEFVVHFDTTQFPGGIAVEEVTGFAPNVVGDTGVIYHDRCAAGDDNDVDVSTSAVGREVPLHLAAIKPAPDAPNDYATAPSKKRPSAE